MSKRASKLDPDFAGGVSFEEAGVNLADLEAEGFFADVTDEMRRAAHAEFAKIFARRNPPQVWPGCVPASHMASTPPAQGDLFRTAL